jgi:hypothetical protein
VLEELHKMSLEGECCVRLVVNSRMELGGGLDGADQIHLGALHPEDAQELLQLHGGKEVQWKEYHVDLVQICEGNPLALTLVGGLIAARRCTPEVPHQVPYCEPCAHVPCSVSHV